ncbi:MAG: hypothetical protein ABSF59_24375 [Candidatus Sulfotelmatobacter sp.]
MRSRIFRVGGNRPHQQIAGGEKLKVPKLGPTLGIEALGLLVRWKRGAGCIHGLGRGWSGPESRAQTRTSLGGEFIQLFFRSGERLFGDGLARGCVLQPDVHAKARLTSLFDGRVGTGDDEISARVDAHANQRGFGKSLRFRKPQIALGTRYIFFRNDAQGPTCREFGAEHFGKRRRQPVFLGTSGQITKADHGNRTPRDHRSSGAGFC